ncbi:MAG: ABC transporter ATP-binding protein [Clostridia bacterium]|nr:ABC transporter ATP-binding protein [Clostridia bacterium]
MREYLPFLIAGGILGFFSAAMLAAYFFVKSRLKSSESERTMKDGELFKRLLKYAKPYYKSFILVAVLMLLSIAYEVISPALIGDIEEMIKADFLIKDLVAQVIIYVSILAVSVVCSYFHSIILQKTGQKIVSAIREDAFSHIEELSHGQLSSIPVGKLVTRVSNDAEAVSRMFTSVIINLLKNALIIVGVTAAMFVLNYALALMVMFFAPFIVLITVLFRKFARIVFRKEKECTSDINAFLSENLSGMKITQIFNRTDYKYEQFSKKCKNLRVAEMNTIYMFGVFRPIVYLIYISTVLLLFYFGGKGYLDGGTFMGTTITGGIIVSFYMYIMTFFDPIQNLAELFNVMQSAFASAEKIFLVMDTEPKVKDEAGAVELKEVKGDIEFKDVWFSYVPDVWVLKGVSFKIRAGETVAFIGATGAGKTTILALLCRNYDVNSGEILLDGVNIKNYTVKSLRRHFGQMMQDVFLFAGSVRDNITLREEKTDEEIMEACRFVNADRLIEKLPGGLDEPLNQRSNNLSAGERQLISFARMLIHRPEVMILDEATANIDTETETLIQNSLEKLMDSGTMLIVAHRLSTVKRADNIIVLNRGEVVEQGKFSELKSVGENPEN